MIHTIVRDLVTPEQINAGEVGTALCEVLQGVVRDIVAPRQVDGGEVGEAALRKVPSL